MMTWRPADTCPPTAEKVGVVEAPADMTPPARTAMTTTIEQAHPLRIALNVGRSGPADGPAPASAPRRRRAAYGAGSDSASELTPYAKRRDRRCRPNPGGPPRGPPLRMARHRPGRPALAALLARNDLDPSLVEDVIMG